MAASSRGATGAVSVSNVLAANALDAQAAYESVFSLWGAIMGGGQPAHARRRLDGGRSARQLREDDLDAELLGMVEASWSRSWSDEDHAGLRCRYEGVGPGGHFFGAEHTQSRYPDRLPQADAQRLAQLREWREAGSPQLPAQGESDLEGAARAYGPPPMDPAIDEELEAFVARRVAEGGVPTDY